MDNKALGKGLMALISDKPSTESSSVSGQVIYLKVSSIRDNTFQPRQNYDDSKLEELKKSIKEQGILQPILVREHDGGFEVVAGERRLRAARALNLVEIPTIVKKLTDQEALVIALIENIQREELNPIEEAQAYRRLIEEFKHTQETIAQSVSKDRTTISNLLRLLKLPSEIQKHVIDGLLSVGHARALINLEVPHRRDEIVHAIVSKGLSVRETEKLVSAAMENDLRRAKRQAVRQQEIVMLEEVLQKILGTKVRIQAQKKRGKIVVEYYSTDDLKRIIGIFQK